MTQDFGHREFIRTYDLYADSMLGFAYSYVNDRETAKDIVQDVFAKLWAQRTHISASRPLKSFLFTIARNYALNHLRHARVVASNLEPLAEELRQAEQSGGIFDMKPETLRSKLAALPDKQREVLLMCVVENKMYKEVAGELGVSVNTVKTNIRRAITSLRGELGVMLLLALMWREG